MEKVVAMDILIGEILTVGQSIVAILMASAIHCVGAHLLRKKA